MSNKLSNSQYLANCHLSILDYFNRDTYRLAHHLTSTAGLVTTTLGAYLSYRAIRVGGGLILRCGLPICGLLAVTSLATAYLLKPTTPQQVKKVWTEAILNMENVNYSDQSLVPLAVRAAQIGGTLPDQMTWVIDLLESRHADFGIQDEWGNTPLHWSIADTSPVLTRRLIRAISNQNKKIFEIQDINFGGHTPLTLLAKQGYRGHDRDGKAMAYSNNQLVDLILGTAPSSLHIPHKASGLTPLDIAVIKRDLTMVQTLRHHGAAMTKERFDQLMSRHSGLNKTMDFLSQTFDALLLLHVPIFDKTQSVKTSFQDPRLTQALKELLFSDGNLLDGDLPQIEYKSLGPKFQGHK